MQNMSLPSDDAENFINVSKNLLESTYKLTYPDEQDVNPDLLKDLENSAQALCQRFAANLQHEWEKSRLEGWRSASFDYATIEKREKLDPLGFSGGARNPGATWTPLQKMLEEFVALMYSSYIRYVFMQLRNLAGSMAVSASMLFLALHAYPFHPQGALLNAITFLFVCLATVFVVVFYQMDKDPLLSRLSDTQSGKLDAGFAKRLLQFGLLPTLTFLVSQVPELSEALLKVLEFIPGLPK